MNVTHSMCGLLTVIYVWCNEKYEIKNLGMTQCHKIIQSTNWKVEAHTCSCHITRMPHTCMDIFHAVSQATKLAAAVLFCVGQGPIPIVLCACSSLAATASWHGQCRPHGHSTKIGHYTVSLTWITWPGHDMNKISLIKGVIYWDFTECGVS